MIELHTPVNTRRRSMDGSMHLSLAIRLFASYFADVAQCVGRSAAGRTRKSAGCGGGVVLIKNNAARREVKAASG